MSGPMSDRPTPLQLARQAEGEAYVCCDACWETEEFWPTKRLLDLLHEHGYIQEVFDE